MRRLSETALRKPGIPGNAERLHGEDNSAPTSLRHNANGNEGGNIN